MISDVACCTFHELVNMQQATSEIIAVAD